MSQPLWFLKRQELREIKKVNSAFHKQGAEKRLREIKNEIRRAS